jgi:hypothetical protein
LSAGAERLPRIRAREALPPSPAAPQPLARPMRAMPLTRRYESMWLTPGGEIDDTTRIAPATPLFEEAFSALARGSVLTSDTGPVAIEDVLPGMRLLTAEGDFQTVTWVGSLVMYPGGQEGAEAPVGLTRITAEAFGAGRPLPDLVLGPRARICLRDARLKRVTGFDAAFVPARAFIDGVSVIEVTPAAPVTLYHLVLERQSALKVMGLEIESYHPGEGLADMIDPRMLQLFEAVFPQLPGIAGFGPMGHPRLTRFEVEELLGG